MKISLVVQPWNIAWKIGPKIWSFFGSTGLCWMPCQVKWQWFMPVPTKGLCTSLVTPPFTHYLPPYWIPSLHWIWRIRKKQYVYVVKPQFWFSNHKRFPVRYHPIFPNAQLNWIWHVTCILKSTTVSFFNTTEGHFLLIWLWCYWILKVCFCNCKLYCHKIG